MLNILKTHTHIMTIYHKGEVIKACSYSDKDFLSIMAMIYALFGERVLEDLESGLADSGIKSKLDYWKQVARDFTKMGDNDNIMSIVKLSLVKID